MTAKAAALLITPVLLAGQSSMGRIVSAKMPTMPLEMTKAKQY